MRVATALLTGVVLLVSACSDAGLSINEFAVEAQDRAVAHSDESDALQQRHFAGLDDTVARLQQEFEGAALVEAVLDETVRQSTELLAAIADALDRYVQDLHALDAPEAVSAEHQAYVRALDTARAGLAPALEDLSVAVSFEDVDRAIAGSGFADAQHRVEAACHDLETAIGSEGPDVDLRCEVTR